MATVVAIANNKGGVSKTTLTANLGFGLYRRGKKVLLCDMDGQCNLTRSVLTDKENPVKRENLYTAIRTGSPLPVYAVCEASEAAGRLDIVPAGRQLGNLPAEIAAGRIEKPQFILKGLLKPLLPQYDYIFLDCAPAADMMVMNALVAADEVIIPMLADGYSLSGFANLFELMNLARSLNGSNVPRIDGAIFTTVEREVIQRQYKEVIRAKHPTMIYATEIRKCVAVKEAVLKERCDVCTYAPKSKAAADFNALIEEFLTRHNLE